MIYVTLGTQKFPFDRLLQKLDDLIDKNVIKANDIFVQCAYSNYTPRNYQLYSLLSLEQVANYVEAADVVITHAGTGSIVQCIKAHKRTIIFPRLLMFQEHVDNHQVEIAEVFSKKGNATVLYDVEELEKYLINIENVQYIDFILDNSKLLHSIDQYLQDLIK